MRLFHTTGKTWNKVLYQHAMYVIRLSNISIKTNFKQITRVELKLTNLYNTLRRTTFCIWCCVICCRSFTKVKLLFGITFSVTVQCPTICFLEKFWQYSCRKYWNYVFEIKIWQWIRDIYYEWMIIKQSLCLCRLHWYVLPYSSMIWRHDKVVRQKRSGATSHHSLITTVWWYNILYQTG